MRVVFGGASHLVLDRRELADALQIAPESIQENVVVQQAWRAVRIDLQGRLSSRGANQVALSIRDIQRGGQANLICLRIDSPGGPATPALRLVNLLQSLDANAMRSLAFVESEARSVAALVALAADETYARPDAVLGGPGDTVLPRDTLDAIRLPIEEMAGAKNRDWSLLLGLVDPELPVFRYTREGTGATRYLCAAEHAALPESDQWKRGPQLDLAAGLTAQQAVQFGLIAGLADTVEAALSHLHVEDDVELRQPNSFVSAIERLATQPWFARTLLFIAFFALIGEASTPGIGVSGFVSGICFLLFFWCQFFNGTAGWLEILLFAGGLACIAMEIFVLPGFGIFGIGGGIMVLLSIVLASQTFILPRNSYQFEQLPHSVWTVVMACAGVMSAVWFLRRLLAESWLARKLTLVPPSEELDLDRAESLVDWRHLQGKQGLTTTQLTPSGKAQFGDDVIAVISDGLWIPRATRVRVVEVHGNRVVVEPVEEA
jgi:membrane-bound ClpP family serine protease